MNTVLKTLRKNEMIYGAWRNVKNFSKKIARSKYDNYPGLNGRISHNDDMFDNITHYMSVGNSAIENIENALKASNKSFDSLKAILDLPSGHGRVLRLLATKVSSGKITACDIDADGIKFCEKEFHCKKILSNTDISKIRLPEYYSLIWVGSLFTHLDEEAFSSLLKLLFDSLEPGGILVFTTHGNYSVEIFQRYWESDPRGIPVSKEQLQDELVKTNGFYFAPYYNSEGYGISISLKPYVVNLVENLFKGNAKFVLVNERGWDNHQDVFAIQRASKLQDET